MLFACFPPAYLHACLRCSILMEMFANEQTVCSNIGVATVYTVCVSFGAIAYFKHGEFAATLELQLFTKFVFHFAPLLISNMVSPYGQNFLQIQKFDSISPAPIYNFCASSPPPAYCCRFELFTILDRDRWGSKFFIFSL